MSEYWLEIKKDRWISPETTIIELVPYYDEEWDVLVDSWSTGLVPTKKEAIDRAEQIMDHIESHKGRKE